MKFITEDVDRPLTQREKEAWLNPKVQASDKPLYWLSVIKLNSIYMELVDAEHIKKGMLTCAGVFLVTVCLWPIIATLPYTIAHNETKWWLLYSAIVISFGLLVWGGYVLMHTEAFRKTHYPIRLNRKTRRVYVMRKNKPILDVAWDDLFIFLNHVNGGYWGKSWLITAYVLDEESKRMKERFNLANPFLGDGTGALQLWEFIRRYMEEPDGAAQAYNQVEFCMAVDGHRETPAFALLRTYAPYAKWPLTQLMIAPFGALVTLGRLFAVYTSKVPVWPAEIEDACAMDPDDPYQKDERDNGKYGFWEVGWPFISFLVGLISLPFIGYWIYITA